MKLTLQKGLKTDLLTMGTFTEDQVDSILKETQEHLPKDFEWSRSWVEFPTCLPFYVSSCFELPQHSSPTYHTSFVTELILFLIQQLPLQVNLTLTASNRNTLAWTLSVRNSFMCYSV